MRRNALKLFFSRVLPLALPLASACNCPYPDRTSVLVPASDIPDAGIADLDCAQLCQDYGRLDSVSYCAVQNEPIAADAGWAVINCAGLRRCSGRRPAAFAPTDADGFAQLAQLEAAAVTAFRILRDELDAHGAPKSLVRAAEQSAVDEIRHARLMWRLSGLQPLDSWVPEGRSVSTRNLEEIGIENCREGCVREAFGAALARLEARTSRSGLVRRAMTAIFRDEERHAALAFAVDAWIRRRLPQSARVRLDESLRSAVNELRRELRRPVELLLLRELETNVLLSSA